MKLRQKYGTDTPLTLKQMFEFDKEWIKIEGDKIICIKKPVPDPVPDPVPVKIIEPDNINSTALSLLDVPEITKSVIKSYQESPSRPTIHRGGERRLINHKWVNVHRR